MDAFLTFALLAFYHLLPFLFLSLLLLPSEELSGAFSSVHNQSWGTNGMRDALCP